MAEKLVCDKGKKISKWQFSILEKQAKVSPQKANNKRPLFVKKQRKTDEVDVEVLDKEKGIGKA